MKNILLILVIALSSASFGQGNLQFNQVLSYVGSLSCNTNYCGVNSATTYTVPMDKVWKIESAGTVNNAIGGYRSQTYLLINGTPVYGGLLGGGSTYSGASLPMPLNLVSTPIWLKAGDVLSWGMSSNSATGGTFTATIHLSIIEFNIVP